MIRSMTAFADKKTEKEGFVVSSEIRAYNSRYLEVSIRLPARYRHYESSLKQMLSRRVQRGKVEVTFSIRDERDDRTSRYEVDRARAVGYYQALTQLKDVLRIDADIPLDLIARAEGVIIPSQPETPDEFERKRIEETFELALLALDEMRGKEGSFLAADLSSRIDAIEAILGFIRSQAAGLLADYYKRIKERMGRLIGEMIEIDETRIAQEAAFYADKSDISEEIVRVESHIEQFRKAMSDGEPCGRKLTFLLQELNREFNTLGAKTGDTEVSGRVVAAKIELEKLREQAQNVE